VRGGGSGWDRDVDEEVDEEDGDKNEWNLILSISG
jgi:hypothetical protein